MKMEFDPDVKPRSRYTKPRDKSHFQMELEDTLRKRNSRLSTSFDSDDDGLGMDDDHTSFPSASSRFMKSSQRDSQGGSSLMASGGWRPDQQQTSYSRSPRAISPAQNPSPRSKLSPGRSGKEPPSAEQIIFGKKGTYEPKKEASAATWSPPSYKKVNFRSNLVNDDDSDAEESPGRVDLGRTSRPGDLESMFRTQPIRSMQKSALAEEEEDDMKIVKPNPRKKSAVQVDDTFDDSEKKRKVRSGQRKSTLLGLDSDDEEDEKLSPKSPRGLHSKGHYQKMYGDSGSRDSSKSLPKPIQRKGQGSLEKQGSRESTSSRSPTGSDRYKSRTPSPTKRESAIEEEPDRESPGRRTSVLDFLKGSSPPKTKEEDSRGRFGREDSRDKRGSQSPEPIPRKSRSQADGDVRRKTSPKPLDFAAGNRKKSSTQQEESRGPRPLEFGSPDRKKSSSREGSPLMDFLSRKRTDDYDREEEERQKSGQRGRSVSPDEKKAAPRRSRPTNDLLGSSSTERVLRKQKGVEKQGSSSRSSSSSSDDDKRPGLAMLPEPTRSSDRSKRGVLDRKEKEERVREKEKEKEEKEERSSICEELDRDPISVVQDGFKKEATAKQRRKDMEFYSEENRQLETAINLVADEQSRDESPKTAVAKKKKSDHYASIPPKTITRPTTLNSTGSSDASAEGTISFNDSISLRQTIYEDWYRTKLEHAKLRRKEEKLKQKEEEERKKKEESDKLAEKKASFNGWVERKKDFFDEQQKKKKQEKKQQEEVEREKREKEKIAELSFNQWKAKKSEKIKENVKEKRKEEHKKRIEEDEEKKRKEKDADKAFESWKNKKDERLKSAAKEKKKSARSEHVTKEEESKKKDEEARKAFEEWEKKQREREYQKLSHQRQTEELQMNRRAWRPSSRTAVERR